jgi:hypothetical protein
MNGPETVPRLLAMFSLGTDHLDEYQISWSIRCPECGVVNGLCLSNSGIQSPKPHHPRIGKARRAARRKASR